MLGPARTLADQLSRIARYCGATTSGANSFDLLNVVCGHRRAQIVVGEEARQRLGQQVGAPWRHEERVHALLEAVGGPPQRGGDDRQPGTHGL